MRIEIHYTKFQAAPNISEYAKKRIGALKKFLKRFEKNTEVAVFVELARTTQHHRKGDVFYAEVTLKIPGKPMRATSTGSDIRLAIDEVKEKLEKELRRDKDKELAKRRHE